jgi:hypothetical protein
MRELKLPLFAGFVKTFAGDSATKNTAALPGTLLE